MRKLLIIGTIAVAMAATPAFARGKKTSAKAGRATSDQTFVMNVLKDGMAEVELGKLAAEKAASDEVKRFAQRMVDDHTKAGDELKSIAQTKNITAPTDIAAKDKALRGRLSKLSGAAFDRAYMQDMVADHRKAVAAIDREAKAGRDPEVKAWADKTLPTIKDHLKMAEDARKTAVGTSGTRTSAAPSPAPEPAPAPAAPPPAPKTPTTPPYPK